MLVLVQLCCVRFAAASRHHEPNLPEHRSNAPALDPSARNLSAHIDNLLRSRPFLFARNFSSVACRGCDYCNFSLDWRGPNQTSYPDRLLRVRTVCRMHGLPWRVGAIEAGLATSHPVLPDDLDWRRSSWSLCSCDRSSGVHDVVRISSGAVADYLADVHRSHSRPGIMGL